jgi:nucleoside-diphosphate-sugar epimerase
MNILITGATGFVGSHVAERLLADGHKVRALVRGSSDLKWLRGLDIETVKGNMLDPSSLKDAMQGIEAIVHIAGVTASNTKQGFIEGNITATRGLLEAAKLYAPNLQRFIHISSQTAGGPSPENILRTEDMPPRPLTTYGKSKLGAEQAVMEYYDVFPGTILRLPVIYGPRDSAVHTFFQAISRGIKPLIGFSDKYVNLLHVSDIAESISLALSNDVSKNRLYNVGAPDHKNWRELSDITARIMGKRGFFVNVPHTLVTIIAGLSEGASRFKTKPSVLNWEKRLDITEPRWTIDTGRIQNELGFIPKVSVDEGFRDTIEWYKKEGWL